MGEEERKARKSNSTRSGRILAFGGTGFALSVAMLMVLAPATGAASAHPAVVLIAPYKGTISSPNIYTDLQGCGTLKSVPAKWAPSTGGVTTSVSAAAHTCGKSFGSVGANSYASASPGLSVAVPFKVGSNGNHSVAVSFSLSVATTSAYAAPFCKLGVNYAPAKGQYSYGYCEAGADVYIQVSAQLADLNNGSYYAYNYSYAESYNDSYTENYSDCYNYAGTPTCYNSNGSHTYAGAYSYNAAGAMSASGSSTFTLWTNGTMMVKGHHYAVVLSLYIGCSVFAEKYNVIGPWAGSASGSVNMGTLGNGMVLKSVTIV